MMKVSVPNSAPRPTFSPSCSGVWLRAIAHAMKVPSMLPKALISGAPSSIHGKYSGPKDALPFSKGRP